MAAFEAVCDGKVRSLTTARDAPKCGLIPNLGPPIFHIWVLPYSIFGSSHIPNLGPPIFHIWQVLSAEQFKALDESESLWRPYGERALLAVAHLDHAIPGYWTQKLRDRFYVKRRDQKVEIKVEALCQVRSPLMALDGP